MTDNVLKMIYDSFQDDLSKYIFSQRVCFSLTDDYKYIYKILQKADSFGKEFNKILNRDVVIFSAGRIGKMIRQNYRNLNIVAFVDNFPKTSVYEGVPVLTFQEYLKNYKEACVLIANRYDGMEIYKQLLDAGIDEDKIINVGLILRDRINRQYFDLPQLNDFMSDEEVFIDCGCFDGFSAQQFVNWCHGKFKKIWAFEPDKINFANAKRKLDDCCNGKYELVNSGVWNENTELRFLEEGTVGSSINQDGDSVIKVNRLDDVVQEKVTFIKMDIEGAEYEALQGCKQIIQSYKPKLAISVYHKKDDVLRIPEIILEMNPSYHFYLRHYSVTEHDTILYAI